MIARLLLQNSIFVVALGALLFASAGSLHWPAAWVFLMTSAILGPACGLWLAKTDPALLSTAFIMSVFRANSFAAPVVKVQAARRHRVISSGPYAFVRHPMYSSIMLFFVGVPAAAGIVVGRGDRAGYSRPDRGARAGRRTA
jgi:protein-S-isoprenylcysteine O-methyltransferase Ste14